MRWIICGNCKRIFYAVIDSDDPSEWTEPCQNCGKLEWQLETPTQVPMYCKNCGIVNAFYFPASGLLDEMYECERCGEECSEIQEDRD